MTRPPAPSSPTSRRWPRSSIPTSNSPRPAFWPWRGNDPEHQLEEFFVTEEATRGLDFNYTIFGFQTAGEPSNQAIAAMADESSTQDPTALYTCDSGDDQVDLDLHGHAERRAGVAAAGGGHRHGHGHGDRQRRHGHADAAAFTVTIAADSSSNAGQPLRHGHAGGAEQRGLRAAQRRQQPDHQLEQLAAAPGPPLSTLPASPAATVECSPTATPSAKSALPSGDERHRSRPTAPATLIDGAHVHRHPGRQRPDGERHREQRSGGTTPRTRRPTFPASIPRPPRKSRLRPLCRPSAA